MLLGGRVLPARHGAGRAGRGWEYAYGLAVTQALVGLNPLEPLARDLQRAVRLRNPKRWARAAGRLPIPYD